MPKKKVQTQHNKPPCVPAPVASPGKDNTPIEVGDIELTKNLELPENTTAK